MLPLSYFSTILSNKEHGPPLVKNIGEVAHSCLPGQQVDQGRELLVRAWGPTTARGSIGNHEMTLFEGQKDKINSGLRSMSNGRNQRGEERRLGSDK